MSKGDITEARLRNKISKILLIQSNYYVFDMRCPSILLTYRSGWGFSLGPIVLHISEFKTTLNTTEKKYSTQSFSRIIAARSYISYKKT